MRYETELFRDQLGDVRKRDKRAAEQIDSVLERVVASPQAHDGQLKGDLAGHFKKKAVEKKYRIVYRYCRYCMQTKKKRCEDCEGQDREADSVILEEVFLRRDGYD